MEGKEELSILIMQAGGSAIRSKREECWKKEWNGLSEKISAER